ncbi:hypothetical protein NDU88_002721 [Pleurodeles waltl]|uniref:Uncharacterized protein n=1 Tax=Pleurodeles waltl TaxID=8319 RepID=A0AAV7UWZ6_PLEWA|nr:hypothetical protein NDU88_002721 [Pleurodeles waltl]
MGRRTPAGKRAVCGCLVALIRGLEEASVEALVPSRTVWEGREVRRGVRPGLGGLRTYGSTRAGPRQDTEGGGRRGASGDGTRGLASAQAEHASLVERLRCLNYAAHSAHTHAAADRSGKLFAWLIRREQDRAPIMELR